MGWGQCSDWEGKSMCGFAPPKPLAILLLLLLLPASVWRKGTSCEEKKKKEKKKHCKVSVGDVTYQRIKSRTNAPNRLVSADSRFVAMMPGCTL